MAADCSGPALQAPVRASRRSPHRDDDLAPMIACPESDGLLEGDAGGFVREACLRREPVTTATNTASVKAETSVEVNGLIKSPSIYRLGFSGQGVREARGLVRSNDLSGGAAIRCVPNIDPLFWTGHGAASSDRARQPGAS